MTTFGNNNCIEYKEDKNKLSKINNKRTIFQNISRKSSGQVS